MYCRTVSSDTEAWVLSTCGSATEGVGLPTIFLKHTESGLNLGGISEMLGVVPAQREFPPRITSMAPASKRTREGRSTRMLCDKSPPRLRSPTAPLLGGSAFRTPSRNSGSTRWSRGWLETPSRVQSGDSTPGHRVLAVSVVSFRWSRVPAASSISAASQTILHELPSVGRIGRTRSRVDTTAHRWHHHRHTPRTF